MEGTRFVKKGDKVIMKEEVKNREFTPKEIIDNIDQMKNMMDKFESEIEKFKENIRQVESEKERIGELLKEVKKHESWAEEYQLSKLRTLAKELTPEAVNSVNKEYIVDNALGLEGNNRQRYAQLQNRIGRHPKVAENISSRYIKQVVYGPELLENPWVE